MSAPSEEESMDRIDVLAWEMRGGFAEMRGLADVRTQQAERHGTLMDAMTDLRNEHTRGD